jgi:ATP-dependent RNA helicase RhlE
MYQQSNNRSSIRGGNRKSFRSPQGGGFNRSRVFSSRKAGNQRKVANLIVNPALYINKASTPEVAQYSPHNSFEDFNLVSTLKQNIKHHSYQKPTPIQDQAINPILEGRDVIGLASTGTGKTAAFLIPLINKMFTTRSERTLIIAPTRELALQINEEFRKFAWDMKLYSALIIGGANMNRQINDIRRNPHVVIATPGRLKDLIERKLIYLEDYTNIVLDEVDLMVDIGFINDVKYFISLLPQKRQSLFFSATISPRIQTILKAFVTDPVTISVKKQDTSENVDQNIIKVSHPSKKVDQLHDLLIQTGFDKVLIFGRTKHGVEKLHKELEFRGFKTGAIHGNKSQGQRQRVLNGFKRDEIKILLATDVASRGLDIENVTHVINFELPDSYEDYIHRIGRTGRAGNKGTALTFID